MGKMLLNGVEYVGGRNTGGASALEDLTDVNVSSITDGQILKYDSTTSKWVNNDESGGTVTDVQVNGTTVVDSNKVAQITSYKELTRAEYDLLPDTKYSDGIMYCISDGFDNANGFPPLIYSTEEREVGVWIDGKPLYQKTVSLGSLTKDSNWHIVNHNIQDIDTIANFNAFMLTDNSGWYSMNVYRPDYTLGCVVQANKTSFNYLNNWQAAATNAYATIWYTKTTDTAGSGKWATDGGLAKHYSTQEQIIGTWIDGKPLYQKTINGEVIETYSSGTVDLSSLNIATFVGVDSGASYFIRADNSQIMFLNANIPANAEYGFAVSYGNNNLLVETRKFGISSYIVTIQYTKTTD